MIRKIVLALLLGVVVPVACSGNGSSSTAEESATLVPVPAEYAGFTNPYGKEAADEGAEIFRINCEGCHGPEGHGDGPAGQALEPRPKNLAEIQSKAGDDFLFWRISEGKPGTSMVPWKGILTDEQIWHAISFIRTLK